MKLKIVDFECHCYLISSTRQSRLLLISQFRLLSLTLHVSDMKHKSQSNNQAASDLFLNLKMALHGNSILAILALWLCNLAFLCDGKLFPYAEYDDAWPRDVRNMSNSSMIKDSFIENLVSNLTIPELGQCLLLKSCQVRIGG